MSIKYLPNRAGSDLRAFQQRMTEVGRIRLGRFNPEGRGRPEKLGKFRFTSPDEGLIRAVAELYGGEPAEWTPQGGRARQYEVFSEVNAVPVYVPQQKIEPWNEAWAPGTCVRRCDGEFETIKGEACVCALGRLAAKDLCKPTVRVQLMLAEVPGIGTWRLESHGANACAELATLAPLIAAIPMPIPAALHLRAEQRRTWNAEKGKFETNSFYVPFIHISAVSAQQIAVGGDALTRALTAAGAPAAIGGGEAPRAIEQAPSPAAIDPPTPTGRPQPAAASTPELDPTELARVLAAIEQADIAKLDMIREALKARGIRTKSVQDAWVSRRAGLLVAAELEGQRLAARQEELRAGLPSVAARQEHARSLRDVATRQPATDDGGTIDAEVLDETEHPDYPGEGAGIESAEATIAKAEAIPVGGTMTVAGVEFTKVAEDPFPAQTYDVNGEYALLTATAGPKGWTTAQLNDRIRAYCAVATTSAATGDQLHQMRGALERGEIQ